MSPAADPTPDLPPTPAPPFGGPFGGPLGAPLGDDEVLTPAQQRIVLRWLGAVLRWALRGLRHPTAVLALLVPGTTIASLRACALPSAPSAVSSAAIAALATHDTAQDRERAELRDGVRELRVALETRTADLARGICAGQTTAQRQLGRLPCRTLLDDGAGEWRLPVAPSRAPAGGPAITAVPVAMPAALAHPLVAAAATPEAAP